jgi:transcriptional regulator with XRE-family HTH domain
MTHLACGKRMRDLREALGHDRKTDFARLLGITLARWSRIEQGCPITIKMATRMREKIPGLTTDYILDGDTAGLSENLRLLLRVPESNKTFPPLPLGPAFGRTK